MRLPDEMVAFLDQAVATGRASSRAAIVTSAVEREMRRLLLTREAARSAMTKVTIAPLTSTIKGLFGEVRVGPGTGLDSECVVALDNATTIPVALLGRTVGYLNATQEAQLARAVVIAYDLDLVAELIKAR